MGVKGILLQLDHGYRQIGAVIGNPLEIGDQVVKYKAVLQSTEAFLQAIDVPVLQFVAEIVDELLQRLDHVGALFILFRQGPQSEIQNLFYRRLHHPELINGVRAEGNLLVMDFFCTLGNVGRMV